MSLASLYDDLNRFDSGVEVADMRLCVSNEDVPACVKPEAWEPFCCRVC